MIYKICKYIIPGIFLLTGNILASGSFIIHPTSVESDWYLSEFGSAAKNDDTTKVLTDSNFIKLQQALILSKIEGNEILEANSYDQIGDFYSRLSFNDSALLYFKKALEIGMRIDYKNYFPRITQKMANKYWDIGEYYEALRNGLLLKEYFEKEKVLEENEYLINLLGIIYLRLKDYSEAYEYFQHAIRISERKNNHGLIGVIYSNIGDLYFEQGKYSEALVNFEKGVALEEENKLYINAGRSYESIARVYIALEEPKKAEEQLNKAIKYNQITSDIDGLTRTYLTFGKLFNYLKQNSTAIEYLAKAEVLAQKTGSKEYYMSICEQFSIAYQNTNDFKRALFYNNKYIALHKEVFSFQDFTELMKLKNDLRQEKQNNEISAYKIQKQRVLLLLLIVGVFLSLIISLLFIVLYNRTNKSKKALLALNIEINEQKDNLNKINIELKEAKKNAEAVNELKSSFLSNLSHEIRTPLNAILGFSELLQSTEGNQEDTGFYLEQINNGKDDLLNLVENVVFAAQIETKQFISIKKQFNLYDRINNLVSDSKKLLLRNDKSQIDFITHFNSIKDITIEADESNILIALRQLISNAIKYTDSGNIELGAELIENSKVRFYLKDTGIGIAENELTKIFDRFYKVESSTDKLFRGAGIGLTIVKGIAEANGGKVWVESKIGEGSTFFFSIPVRILETIPKLHQPQTSISNRIEKWGSRHILIAEDVDTNWNYLDKILDFKNITRFHAKNGKEAIEIVEIVKIDLIVMDILMPLMDGYEASAIIKTMFPSIPIIAHTAIYYNHNHIDYNLLDLFDDYINKPVSQGALIEVLDKYLSIKAEE